MEKIYIDNQITKNRCCYLFLYQQRKLHSFFSQSKKFNITDNINGSNFIIVISCVAVPWTENKTREIIDDYLILYPKKKIICYWCFSNLEDLTVDYWNRVFFVKNEDENLFNSIFIDSNLPIFSEVQEKFWIDFQNNFDKNYERINIWHWCIWNCYFCNHKLTKKLVSKPFNVIKKEILDRLSNWINHFRFIWDDVASYWYDFDKSINFIKLFNKILKINNDFTFSAWPIYPKLFLENKDEIIKLFESWRVTELFIAIEHISPTVLKKMNRNYDINKVLLLLKEIKKKFPWIKVCTHIIYWFPWETYADLKQLFWIMEYFDQVQMFKIWYNRYLRSNLGYFKENHLLLKIKNKILSSYFKEKKWLFVYEDHRIIIIKEKYWNWEKNINYSTF